MIFKIFILWRLGLFVLSIWGLMAAQIVPNGISGLFSPEFVSIYLQSQLQWDGGHYLSIAKFGYLFASDFAFFPLYPLIIKTLTIIIGNEIFWGLLISNLSFFLFLVTIYKLNSKKYSKKVAFNVLVTYLFFPTAFFTTAYYSESLFLLLVSLFLHSIENKKYLLAAIFISLSSLARMIGSFLIISFFYKFILSEKTTGFVPRVSISSAGYKNITSSKKIIYPILSTIGIIIYGAFLFNIVGNPFEFNSVQALWGRQITDPITVLLSYSWSYLVELKSPIDYLDYFLTLVFLTILFLGRYKISSSLWIFSVFAILIPVSSGTLTSMPRYLLSSIGVFVIIGKILEEKPFLKKPVWAISLFLQIILYVRFLSGYWVA